MVILAQHGMTAILEIVEATTTRISLRASDVARAAVVRGESGSLRLNLEQRHHLSL